MQGDYMCISRISFSIIRIIFPSLAREHRARIGTRTLFLRPFGALRTGTLTTRCNRASLMRERTRLSSYSRARAKPRDASLPTRQQRLPAFRIRGWFAPRRRLSRDTSVLSLSASLLLRRPSLPSRVKRIPTELGKLPSLDRHSVRSLLRCGASRAPALASSLLSFSTRRSFQLFSQYL